MPPDDSAPHQRRSRRRRSGAGSHREQENAYWVFEVFATFGLFCFGFFGVLAFLSIGISSDVKSGWWDRRT